MTTAPKEQIFGNADAEPWRRHATEQRTLHCLQFEVDTPEYCAFVSWPFLPEPDKSCAKLLDSRITWLTARAGDTVMMRHGDSQEWTKERIKVVTLFRVHPVRYNDQIVTCGAAWLEGVPAMHKDALGRYADGIPCDLRGYIPTAETRAFDLLWPYEQPTHKYDGYKTEYGLTWERDWPQLLLKRLRASTKPRDAEVLRRPDSALTTLCFESTAFAISPTLIVQGVHQSLRRPVRADGPLHRPYPRLAEQ